MAKDLRELAAWLSRNNYRRLYLLLAVLLPLAYWWGWRVMTEATPIAIYHKGAPFNVVILFWAWASVVESWSRRRYGKVTRQAWGVCAAGLVVIIFALNLLGINPQPIGS
jgi:hypothetical protein